jgi:hypothetical protein
MSIAIFTPLKVEEAERQGNWNVPKEGAQGKRLPFLEKRVRG